MTERTCEICGNKFTTWPNAIRRGNGRYCSRGCVGAANGRRAYLRTRQLRPSVRLIDNYALVPVGPDGWMKVSLEDADALSATTWSATAEGYAVSRNLGRKVRAHRVVLARVLGRDLQESERVDHKDRDPSNNHRSNLRLASASENSVNRRAAADTTSKYRGVARRGSRWRAYVGGKASTGKQLKLGSFETEKEAAWMYDQFAGQLFGDFAILNFDYAPTNARSFDLASYVQRSAVASGVPARVSDQKTLARLASLLGSEMPRNAA